jgi:hypothetical protein
MAIWCLVIFLAPSHGSQVGTALIGIRLARRLGFRWFRMMARQPLICRVRMCFVVRVRPRHWLRMASVSEVQRYEYVSDFCAINFFCFCSGPANFHGAHRATGPST